MDPCTIYERVLIEKNQSPIASYGIATVMTQIGLLNEPLHYLIKTESTFMDQVCWNGSMIHHHEILRNDMLSINLLDSEKRNVVNTFICC